MPGITKTDILASRDIVPQPLDVPEWGGTVYVRPLSARERAESGAKGRQAGDNAEKLVKLNGWLLARSLCDDAGRPLFDDADADAIAAKNGVVVERVVRFVLEMNRMTPESAATLGKGSATTPPGASPID